MKIRKLNYIISYLVVLAIFAFNLAAPAQLKEILVCFIIAFIPALIVGTITNFTRFILKS
ncbi:hypothetical protein [Clostridium butyricum]|uniref:hypothetical protein n=1 Tax=Clostridium butyricum TaxID=1492 RepID=UPI00071E9FA0|nr:hypothetical protein [Clostridium butyricum]ALS17082.1 hypothetical protein ATD26_09470 [Clostridium butyricum]